MNSEHEQHSPSCSRYFLRNTSGHKANSSSPDAKPSTKFPAVTTPQAAPQPTKTSFLISDILNSTSSSKTVHHPTPLISANHHHHPTAPSYAASYPVNTADESAYSEGRDSPTTVMSDDADCKEREGSVGESESDVERSGGYFFF